MKFDVFSEQVVVYPEESFEWYVSEGELPPGVTSVKVEPAGSGWPLSAPEYTVTVLAPQSAQVKKKLEQTEAGFQCTPPANNVTAQTLMVAPHAPFGMCDDVIVNRGDYFIWKNETNQTAVLKPGAGKFWPLPAQQYLVEAQKRIHVQVSAGADPGDYLFLAENESGESLCNTLGQPKISVGTSEP